MLPIEDALFQIAEQVPELSSETVSLTEARNRILQEDIYSPWDMPRFSNSAMDGYAVRIADVDTASEEHPIRLRVTQEIPASKWSEESLQAGESARIFTGAAIPPGADAVEIQENVTRMGDEVILTRPVPLDKSIRKQGEWMQKGQILLQKGQALDAGAIGVLASVGRSYVVVRRRPRVAVLSCGDELTELHSTPLPGHIYESNRYALHAQIEEAGGIPLLLPLVPDDPGQIRQQLKAGLEADILISSGGVSVGEYDLIRPALEELNVTLHFWKIAIKPGKPVAFGTYQKCIFFGLPGNPASSMVTFDLCVRPAIRKMLGFTSIYRTHKQATLASSVKPAKGRTHFVRGRVEWSSEGYVFTPHQGQSSGDVLSMYQAEACAILQPGTEPLSQGAKVDFIDFSPCWDGQSKW